MANPLESIKVVELATFVAAPVAGRMLADLGAQVIKVESPAGDGWRDHGPRINPKRFSIKGENPVFDIYNTGKDFISLNLKTAEGKEAFFKLLDEADIFLTNTRPAALKRLGLDYESLKDRYPRLIYAIVQGFGDKGPDKDAPAFDTTAFWSRGGFFRDLAPKNPGLNTPRSMPPPALATPPPAICCWVKLPLRCITGKRPARVTLSAPPCTTTASLCSAPW